MKLVIAEKPSLARAIAEAIDSNHKLSKEEGCIRCRNYVVVTWLIGHVLEQYQPDDYSEAWKRWDANMLPMVPEVWKLKESEKAKPIIRNVKKLLAQATEVIHAGDPDREGQLLVDEFLEFFGWKGKTLRLLLKDLTPEAIREAFGSMRDISEFTGLKNAALARQRADWLAGMNATRYFTLCGRAAGYDGVLSIGRVQTPTLGLVAKRDIDIQNFKLLPYCVVHAKIELSKYQNERSFRGVWQPDPEQSGLDEEGRIVDRSIAEELIDKIKNKQATITKYEKKSQREAPPLPYRLADLQIEANRKLGMTLKETLDTVQSLYEKQLVSYPRSDCQYLPESHHQNAQNVISAILKAFTNYASAAESNVDFSRKSKAFDDKKVNEHYAITPTGKSPGELTESEQKVYEFICLRYLIQFFPDYEYLKITAEFKCEGELFKGIGRELINVGWRGIFSNIKQTSEEENDDEDFSFIPPLSVNESGVIREVVIQDKETTPPSHFNDGSLVKAMSNIHKFVSDPEIKKQLKEVDGIGTSATQYMVVERLIGKGLLERKKKEIHSTAVGRILISALEMGKAGGKFLTVPDLTAVWEQQIGKIERGEATLQSFLSGVTAEIEKIVKVPVDGTSFTAMGQSVQKCPKCGGPLRKLKGKNGVFWGCQNPDCKSTFNDKGGKPQPRQPATRLKESTCPSCGGKAVLKEGPYGKYWRCSSCDQYFKDKNGKPDNAVKKSK